MANQNNVEKRSEVTTKGYHATNPHSTSNATALDWGFKGDMLQLAFISDLPESEQTENRRYDYDHQTLTCLTRVKCFDLLNQIRELILPAMKNKVDCFVSVPVAIVNQVGFGVKHQDDKQIMFLRLIRNIDSNTLTSDEVTEYNFKKGEVIKDFDNSTGKFGDRILNETEALLFINDIEQFVNASSKAYTHADRVVNKFYKDTMTSDIRAIGRKVGAEVSIPFQSQRSGASYSQTSLFDNQAPNAPTEQIKSLAELDELPFN